MVTVKLSLDKRYKRSDDTYPLVFRLTYKGSLRYISTGISCKESHWNNRLQLISSAVTGSESLNESLKAQHQEVLARMVEYQKRYTSVNLQEMKDFVIDKAASFNTVDDFWQNEIASMRAAKKFGNASVYKESHIAFTKVVSLDISFKGIDYSWLKKVEVKFQQKSCKVNTISIYFRVLRSLYNKAIKCKIVDFSAYPFRDFRIKREQTPPRVFSLEQMRVYFNLNVSPASPRYKSWLIGKMIFMLRGINMKDICLLTKESVKSDRIIYKRSKTGKIYSMQMLPEVQQILAELQGDFTLLNLLSDKELSNVERLPATIKQRTKIVNKHLDKLGKLMEVDEPLTTYVFRYSWANIAKQLGYSKDMIAEGLGHEYGNSVTGIYLQQYDLKHIDEMNKAVYNSVRQTVSTTV
jgi:integrase/recombinase XerD